ncbi:hypothetical protein BBK82_13105 [Lentzea guizhouensis]|uniref:Uncharacterized protein n=1 Tax=Lentzea guizhouensis TaxID=1586287 RepID=A0A1B2HGM6_9PSEU|nr:hypothetical protein [Lentzea guizhouensis]ANZ36873.1 hypothetical protein BBK82_13105 [Lentzea guizhouensis]
MDDYIEMHSKTVELLRAHRDAPEISFTMVELHGRTVKLLVRSDKTGAGVFEWARRLGLLVHAREGDTYVSLEASQVIDGITFTVWTHVHGRAVYELFREFDWTIDEAMSVLIDPATRRVVPPRLAAVS